jgi:hypothetical protein
VRPSIVNQITALRASLAVALMSGLVVAGGCSSSPNCPPGAPCPETMPRVTFTPTVNGQPAVRPRTGGPHRYHVRPGERLVVKVAVTVPRHLTVTALWFGISTGILGGGPNGTGSMHPILAHYRQPLLTVVRGHQGARPSYRIEQITSIPVVVVPAVTWTACSARHCISASSLRTSGL